MSGRFYRALAIGPLVEVVNLASAEKLHQIRQESWLSDGSLEPLLDAFLAKPRHWLARDARQGLVTGDGLEKEDVLSSFKIDAHKAAKNAGFGAQAGMLVAALGELVGNVVDHSQDPRSAAALFSAGKGEFEFVVADHGIGVLDSLTQNPENAMLSDHGEALQAMVEAGVSRFTRDTGHGNGFRPIFEKLADMTGELRFRSGDYVLTLDGRFGDRIARQTNQKARLRGFLAAVSCKIRPRGIR
ncbi:hypothetical protein [Sphingobium sp. BS19]|uniref:hypothetical protein n=1 Tax=Sphingobium sp. BS19 TaxID=3018973 RepID=UPI0022EE93F5|nr:hypothetical protein [Sphingobium sp. BS19]GLI97028.1 hypothetical protein Sbs19_08460 [Sphingobium sp. BS19]